MLRQLIHEAIVNLLASGHRAVLALIGIVIGTASVIAMINVGEMVERKSLDELRALGPDLFVLSIQDSAGGGQMGGGSGAGLDPEALETLKARVPGLRVLAPMLHVSNGIQAKGYEDPAFIVATSESMMDLVRLRLASGRFLSHLDGAQPFLVVGSEVFADDDDTRPRVKLRVGDAVRIGFSLFTVIGVLQPLAKNPLLPIDPNESVLVTAGAAKRIAPSVKIDTIGGRVAPGYDLQAVGDALKSAVSALLPDAQLHMETARELIETIREQSRLFTLLLGAIGSISLIVGGVGVMNIMFVSVAERQREIGLRLAIGATRRDIVCLFLVEATILSMGGGFIGFMLGMAASFGFGLYSDVTFFVSEIALILGVVVSLMVGIFFGYYPASRAARLDPVDALRSE